MSNSHGSLNAQGGSENQDFTKEPTLEYASKGGGSQEAGQQRLLESAGEHPWDQSMDPLWQHDESWILNGPQISSTVQSNPNPIELSLFPQPTGAPAQTYLGTDQEAHIRLGPVDLGEGDGNRLHSAPWPGADPGRPELAPWYPYQLSLKPSVAERVRQRSGPSTKPPKNIREVQIPRARYSTSKSLGTHIAHISFSRSENIVVRPFHIVQRCFQA